MRAAIICANAKTEKTEIKFNLGSNGPYLIDLKSNLPDLVNVFGVKIDGASQWNFLSSSINDTIKIKGFGWTIGGQNSNIKNLKFDNVQLTSYSNDFEFNNNQIVNSKAIRLTGLNNKFNSNYVFNSSDWGVYFNVSNKVEIAENKLVNCISGGIRCRGTFFKVHHNTIINSGIDGITLDRCNNSKIESNFINSSVRAGIFAFINNDTIINNTINGSLNNGIHLIENSNVNQFNIINNNSISNCDSSAVYSIGSNRNLIFENQIENCNNGFKICSQTNKISQNTSLNSTIKNKFIESSRQ